MKNAKLDKFVFIVTGVIIPLITIAVGVIEVLKNFKEASKKW